MSNSSAETTSDPNNSEAETAKAKRRRRGNIAGILFLALLAVAFRLFCGFYSVQPIGALPEGKTLIVLRGENEPFFNSPDATCLSRLGYVSLMCRGMSVALAPTDRIIMRLPYQKWAYSASTGGKSFDR